MLLEQLASLNLLRREVFGHQTVPPAEVLSVLWLAPGLDGLSVLGLSGLRPLNGLGKSTDLLMLPSPSSSAPPRPICRLPHLGQACIPLEIVSTPKASL